MKFQILVSSNDLKANPPDLSQIPPNEVVGVTAILLTCSYKQKEFFRVGYYINISYTEPELIENPPSTPIYEALKRTIMIDEPRVTNFPIQWDAPSSSFGVGEYVESGDQQAATGFSGGSNMYQDDRRDFLSAQNIQTAQNLFNQQQ